MISIYHSTHLTRLILDASQHSQVANGSASRFKRRLEPRRRVANLLHESSRLLERQPAHNDNGITFQFSCRLESAFIYIYIYSERFSLFQQARAQFLSLARIRHENMQLSRDYCQLYIVKVLSRSKLMSRVKVFSDEIMFAR